MPQHPSSIPRRDFLQTCAVTGAGLSAGLHRGLLKAAASSSGGKPAIGNIRAGLDIGSSKVCVAVGELLPDGTLKILGIGQAPSQGVTAHGIVDCQAASACIRAALADAEIQSDVMIRSVVLAVPGTKIAAYGSGLTWEDIFEWEKVCYAERGDGILQPVSLAECRRAPDTRIVYGAHERIQNSIRGLQSSGVEVERLIYSPVASATAMVSPISKELGVLHIDMGEGTTDYTVYAGDALEQSDSLPTGGGRIANELALALEIPLDRARRLLIEEGSAWRPEPGLRDGPERIVLPREPGFSGAEIEREALNTIIRQCVRGVFERLKCQLTNSGVEFEYVFGVLLSGGCTRLGLEHLAMEIFDLLPNGRHMRGIDADNSILNNSRLACAVGLIKLAAHMSA